MQSLLNCCFLTEFEKYLFFVYFYAYACLVAISNAPIRDDSVQEKNNIPEFSLLKNCNFSVIHFGFYLLNFVIDQKVEGKIDVLDFISLPIFIWIKQIFLFVSKENACSY